MKRKGTGGVYDYLASIPGLLERGNPEEIAQARREYWKMRQKGYAAKRRMQFKVVKVELSPKDYERLRKEAMVYLCPLAVFLRRSSLSYVDLVYCVPNEQSVRKVEAMLVRTLSAVEKIAQKGKKSWLSFGQYETVKDAIEEMRKEAKMILANPALLEDAVRAHPELWESLKRIMQSKE